MDKKEKICVVGLGYVGLPLALHLAEAGWEVFGYDVSQQKIKELSNGIESMGEVDEVRLQKAKITYSSDSTIIRNATFIIVTVPTPINKFKKPDLSIIKRATETVADNLRPGAVIVYESTVYPGVTEEVCLPILEEYNGLKYKKDFFLGYSPERINPGDKEHTIDKVVKIVAGDTPETLNRMDVVYSSICKAGIHKVSCIRAAEAAKVIENTQRDLNIALVNELALIFDRIGIDTKEVIEAAGTKWNFHEYYPGFVGGHCIGVDPYYLVYKAEELGYHPQIITAGRKVNDDMPHYVADQTIKMLIHAGKAPAKSRVLIMGLTFKEDVKDCRNSKAKELIDELKEYMVQVYGHEPLVDKETISEIFGVENLTWQEVKDIDGIVWINKHKIFSDYTLENIRKKCGENPVLFDVKGIISQKKAKEQGFLYKDL